MIWKVAIDQLSFWMSRDKVLEQLSPFRGTGSDFLNLVSRTTALARETVKLYAPTASLVCFRANARRDSPFNSIK